MPVLMPVVGSRQLLREKLTYQDVVAFCEHYNSDVMNLWKF